MDISEFSQTFFDEADELLGEMEQLLVALDPAVPDTEQLNAIFRAAHSIKGGAGTFGFTLLQETTHLLESLLDRARHGQITLDTAMVDVFLQTGDTLEQQVRAYRDGNEPDTEACERICGLLRVIAEDSNASATIAEPEPATPAAQDNTDSTAADQSLVVTIHEITKKDSRTLAGELALLGSVTSQHYVDDTLTAALTTTEAQADIEAVLCFLVDAEQIHIAPQAQSQPDDCRQAPTRPAAQTSTAKTKPSRQAGTSARSRSESGTLRVSTEKIDQIINLVGELVITQSMLEQTASGLDAEPDGALAAGMNQLQRNARDLQQAIMSVRMVPMDYAFSRFPRLVRDLSATLGKQVTLKTEGAATELDKGLIEHIMDPLTHLVRNSLDHGIETPEQRIAAGKPAAGTLTLAAQHQGGHILIEITDDGAGLDRKRILAKAAENGLPAAADMPAEDVWQLIFAPGFSTAEAVTDVSGRGVGMDVVKRNIQKLGGHVDIRSTTGGGTTISIVLPLTLAIMEGMSVQVGSEIFILPLSAIMESMQVGADQVNRVAGADPVLHVRGEYLSLTELRRMFDVPGATADLDQGIVMVLQSEGRRFAILVDQLLGQHQVVVKNLETNYRRIEGISAATILGDGSVALILDVVALSRSDKGRRRAHKPRHTAGQHMPRREEEALT